MSPTIIFQLLYSDNSVLNPLMCMHKLLGVPSIPLFQDVSHCWSLLAGKIILQFLSLYYLATKVKFLVGEGKCQGSYSAQL
jgi:hypothetical protein